MSRQSQTVGQALQYIAQLYEIEREGAALNAAGRQALCQHQVQPVDAGDVRLDAPATNPHHGQLGHSQSA